MEKIVSYDNNGNRIVLEVNRKKEQSKYCPEIEIANYGLFKLCVTRSREEQQVADGKGDKRYDRALGELARKDREKYLYYQRKMTQEFRDSFK